MNLKHEIEGIAKSFDVDLVGFARVDGIQLAHHARDLYLDQPACKNHYIRPYLDHTTWQTIKNIFRVEGYGATGIQVLLEGYHFSCAECQRICPEGRIENKKPDLPLKEPLQVSA
jgi:hypothetical protein